MFITFEGIEGSGKSTLLAGIAHRLRQRGYDPVLTREPGGTPLGDLIRDMFLHARLSVDPLAEAFLINASRAQHVFDVIRPALAAGRPVLCDRYTDSTLAYQGYGGGLDLAELAMLCDAATGSLAADLTLLADVAVTTSRSRMATRGTAQDRVESQDAAFHERVRTGYLHLADENPRIVKIDGEKSVEAMLDSAWRAMGALLA